MLLPLYCSSSPCSEENISETLSKLGIDQDVRTNEQLVADLIRTYGPSIISELKKTHVLVLNSPKSLIDTKTLRWIEDAIRDGRIGSVVYLALNLNITKNSIGSGGDNDDLVIEYIRASYLKLVERSQKVILVFGKKDDFFIFKGKVDVYLEGVIKESSKYNQDKIKQLIDLFKKTYLTENGHQIGFSTISISNPRIILTGHSHPGQKGLIYGDKIYIPSRILVETLLQQGLPKDANIQLHSCYSGCNSNQLDLTSDEIKLMFQWDMLRFMYTSIKSSFMEYFAIELINQSPNFEGKVSGFIGKVFYGLSRNVLRKDGTVMKWGHQTIVTGKDGIAVSLKREDLMVSVSPSDYKK